MQVIRPIGLEHGDWSTVRETIRKGDTVTIRHESKWDKAEGIAYAVEYNGKLIGYIPLVSTLRGYYKAAKSDAERERIAKWSEAVSRVREWLDSSLKYWMKEEWEATVQTLLYRREDGCYTEQKCGKPVQISIVFEEVE